MNPLFFCLALPLAIWAGMSLSWAQPKQDIRGFAIGMSASDAHASMLKLPRKRECPAICAEWRDFDTGELIELFFAKYLQTRPVVEVHYRFNSHNTPDTMITSISSQFASRPNCIDLANIERIRTAPGGGLSSNPKCLDSVVADVMVKWPVGDNLLVMGLRNLRCPAPHECYQYYLGLRSLNLIESNKAAEAEYAQRLRNTAPPKF